MKNNNTEDKYCGGAYSDTASTSSDSQQQQQISERAVALIATKQEEIAIRQEQREHLMRMAAFWHECEVSLPNKLVAVPRSQFNFKPQAVAAIPDEKLRLKHVKSFNTSENSTEAVDSSSSGSGSQRSAAGDDLSLLLQTTTKTTTTTTTATIAAER